MTDNITDAVDRYVAFWETLSPDSLTALDAYFQPTIRFRDPFNDVTGIAALRAILEKMFDDVVEPRFRLHHWACADNICYLRWQFSFASAPGGAERLIEGVSEVHFAADGRVQIHIDHWDPAAQLYESVPVLGSVLRAIRRRLGSKEVTLSRQSGPCAPSSLRKNSVT